VNDVPSWWEFLLLALAAFRVWRLLAEVTILDKPRRKLLRLSPEWEEEGDDPGPGYRKTWGEFFICPWCLGFWIALAWWGAWLFWPHAATLLAVPWAISAFVGLVAHFAASE